MQKKKRIDWAWDCWCVASLIGIWPRFIEPKLISTTKINLPITNLPPNLQGTTILQFSDLHWSQHFSPSFAERLIKKINKLNADLIVFTGDFLSRSKLENPTGLQNFLCSLKAKAGCFACFGNHDYADYVTPNSAGDYDVEVKQSTDLNKGFKRLFKKFTLSKKVSAAAQKVDMHSELLDLLKHTPFVHLDNFTQQVSLNNSWINISGLGEYTLGRSLVKKTFDSYDLNHPGIILTHNPDSIPLLENYPGDLILSGHTHGGQVNLPIMWKQFTHMEQMDYKRGLKRLGDKWIYINRGVGAVMPFRWFSVPELTLFTLQKGEKHGK